MEMTMTDKSLDRSRNARLAALLVAAAAWTTGTAALAEQLPLDRPTTVNGIVATCTGSGDNERQSAQGTNNPVRFEFVGGYGQYLGNETVSVADSKSNPIASVFCGSAWVLMQLPPGRYQVTAEMPGAATQTQWVSVSDSGPQQAVFFRYPEKRAGEPRGHGGCGRGLDRGRFPIAATLTGRWLSPR
ncbi:MAG: carboxypeptidase regulatory-like domain-containing protein, partial [Alphaproteobacteria bacterium]|nr:carboxypeptidase regulatory-like domain-containing protein [Alphaproteobacteria bacterium]